MKHERYPLEHYSPIPPRAARRLRESLDRIHDIYDTFETTPRKELTVELLSGMIEDMHFELDFAVDIWNGTQRRLFKYLSWLGLQRSKGVKIRLPKV